MTQRFLRVWDMGINVMICGEGLKFQKVCMSLSIADLY